MVDVIAGIYLILGLASFLFWLGLTKQDTTISIIAGFMFGLSGLSIYISGLSGLSDVFSKAIGVLCIGIGAYVMTRSGVEAIQNTYN